MIERDATIALVPNKAKLAGKWPIPNRIAAKTIPII